MIQAVVNIKTKKLCLQTQFSATVLPNQSNELRNEREMVSLVGPMPAGKIIFHTGECMYNNDVQFQIGSCKTQGIIGSKNIKFQIRKNKSEMNKINVQTKAIEIISRQVITYSRMLLTTWKNTERKEKYYLLLFPEVS